MLKQVYRKTAGMLMISRQALSGASMHGCSAPITHRPTRTSSIVEASESRMGGASASSCELEPPNGCAPGSATVACAPRAAATPLGGRARSASSERPRTCVRTKRCRSSTHLRGTSCSPGPITSPCEEEPASAAPAMSPCMVCSPPLIESHDSKLDVTKADSCAVRMPSARASVSVTPERRPSSVRANASSIRFARSASERRPGSDDACTRRAQRCGA
mmetsp:Transcript_41714/g.102932  ORF Transcript_41714/g.102932 Transcript_41714/m.102932 type:complete len:218 (-) Transcript_41714:2116-2769(-)